MNVRPCRPNFGLFAELFLIFHLFSEFSFDFFLPWPSRSSAVFNVIQSRKPWVFRISHLATAQAVANLKVDCVLRLQPATGSTCQQQHRATGSSHGRSEGLGSLNREGSSACEQAGKVAAVTVVSLRSGQVTVYYSAEGPSLLAPKSTSGTRAIRAK